MNTPASSHQTSRGVLGATIPENDVHAISVSLPSWASTLGWANRDPDVVRKMRTGYPRFFIHRLIDELSQKIVTTYQRDHVPFDSSNAPTLFGMIFPSAQYASYCENYLKGCGKTQDSHIKTVIVGSPSLHMSTCLFKKQTDWAKLELYVVLYPSQIFPLAKSFWQHTGFGISSRYAEHCLKHFHQVVVKCPTSCGTSCPSQLETLSKAQNLHGSFVNDSFSLGEDEHCKQKLRRRIAELHPIESGAGPEDVFLYHTGMTAFTNVAQALKKHAGQELCEVVCYGFLYVDTFKVLEKVLKINTTLYGHASASELDALEASLQNGTQKVHALVIEVPQNPLLGTPDLQRIRRLASTFDFLLIIDDTASTPVNTNTLYFGDIVVTSLSKMFSGACNVMGGSVVVNPQSSCAAELRALLTAAYCDVYFPPDAAIMELNSRDFSFRLEQATRNAAQVCSLLRAHPCVSHVYYPLGSASQCFYDMCKTPSGGYGFLLSLKFQLPAQAIAFFDAFDVAKGPSLGTNFTLACPYTLLAHYNELEWAANYGVDEHLVRISVGLEDYEVLRTKIEFALKKCNL